MARRPCPACQRDGIFGEDEAVGHALSAAGVMLRDEFGYVDRVELDRMMARVARAILRMGSLPYPRTMEQMNHALREPE